MSSETFIEDPNSDSVQSDLSDAPEGVSWKDSKAVFQQTEKDRNDAVSFARSADKAKRRKKNEMFVSQKEAKRKLSKLPEDIVLQAIAKKAKHEDKTEKEKSKKIKRGTACKSTKSKKKTEEYCNVVVLKKEVNRSKKIQESAAEFLKNHLYGNRLERTSGSKQLTMQSKSSGIIKPAVKFSNKV